MDWECPSLAPAAPAAPSPSSSCSAPVAPAILGDTGSTSEPPKIPSASGKAVGTLGKNFPWRSCPGSAGLGAEEGLGCCWHRGGVAWHGPSVTMGVLEVTWAVPGTGAELWILSVLWIMDPSCLCRG